MFCPNCGKDCKDFKFCPDCGRYLQETPDEQSFEKRREALEKAGKIFCPKCLSVNVVSKEDGPPSKDYLLYRNPYAHLIGNILHLFLSINHRKQRKKGPRNECLNCGCWWYPKLLGLVKRYRPHLEELIGEKDCAVYAGEGGKKLTLAPDSLFIERPGLRPYLVWYWDLYCVKQDLHNKLTDEPEPRWLTICDKKRKRWPGPGTPKLALNDPYAILYEKSQIEEFRKIKNALNGIIEENKEAGLL